MLQSKGTNKLRKSFAMIIGVCMLVIFFVGFDDIRAKVRDAKRKADINEIVKALDIYYDRHGKYPISEDDWQGWDMTISPGGGVSNFLKPLYDENILVGQIKDPLNNNNYFYRYQKFPFGSYDCLSEYYILQIVNFETIQDYHGKGSCPKNNFTEEIPNGFTIMRND